MRQPVKAGGIGGCQIVFYHQQPRRSGLIYIPVGIPPDVRVEFFRAAVRSVGIRAVNIIVFVIRGVAVRENQVAAVAVALRKECPARGRKHAERLAGIVNPIF